MAATLAICLVAAWAAAPVEAQAAQARTVQAPSAEVQIAQAPAGQARADPAPGDPDQGAHEAPPKAGRPQSARSLAHLYELMSRQHPLTPTDMELYAKFAGDIVALDSNQAITPQLLAATGWSEGRMVYVLAKVGLGLTRLIDPESPVLARAPDFAWPDAEEAALIQDHYDSLIKALGTAAPTIDPNPPVEPDEPGPPGQTGQAGQPAPSEGAAPGA